MNPYEITQNPERKAYHYLDDSSSSNVLIKINNNNVVIRSYHNHNKSNTNKFKSSIGHRRQSAGREDESSKGRSIMFKNLYRNTFGPTLDETVLVGMETLHLCQHDILPNDQTLNATDTSNLIPNDLSWDCSTLLPASANLKQSVCTSTSNCILDKEKNLSLLVTNQCQYCPGTPSADATKLVKIYSDDNLSKHISSEGIHVSYQTDITRSTITDIIHDNNKILASISSDTKDPSNIISNLDSPDSSGDDEVYNTEFANKYGTANEREVIEEQVASISSCSENCAICQESDDQQMETEAIFASNLLPNNKSNSMVKQYCLNELVKGTNNSRMICSASATTAYNATANIECGPYIIGRATSSTSGSATQGQTESTSITSTFVFSTLEHAEPSLNNKVLLNMIFNPSAKGDLKVVGFNEISPWEQKKSYPTARFVSQIMKKPSRKYNRLSAGSDRQLQYSYSSSSWMNHHSIRKKIKKISSSKARELCRELQKVDNRPILKVKHVLSSSSSSNFTSTTSTFSSSSWCLGMRQRSGTYSSDNLYSKLLTMHEKLDPLEHKPSAEKPDDKKRLNNSDIMLPSNENLQDNSMSTRPSSTDPFPQKPERKSQFHKDPNNPDSTHNTFTSGRPKEEYCPSTGVIYTSDPCTAGICPNINNISNSKERERPKRKPLLVKLVDVISDYSKRSTLVRKPTYCTCTKSSTPGDHMRSIKAPRRTPLLQKLCEVFNKNNFQTTPSSKTMHYSKMHIPDCSFGNSENKGRHRPPKCFKEDNYRKEGTGRRCSMLDQYTETRKRGSDEFRRKKESPLRSKEEKSTETEKSSFEGVETKTNKCNKTSKCFKEDNYRKEETGRRCSMLDQYTETRKRGSDEFRKKKESPLRSKEEKSTETEKTSFEGVETQTYKCNETNCLDKKKRNPEKLEEKIFNYEVIPEASRDSGQFKDRSRLASTNVEVEEYINKDKAKEEIKKYCCSKKCQLEKFGKCSRSISTSIEKGRSSTDDFEKGKIDLSKSTLAVPQDEIPKDLCYKCFHKSKDPPEPKSLSLISSTPQTSVDNSEANKCTHSNVYKNNSLRVSIPENNVNIAFVVKKRSKGSRQSSQTNPYFSKRIPKDVVSYSEARDLLGRKRDQNEAKQIDSLKKSIDKTDLDEFNYETNKKINKKKFKGKTRQIKINNNLPKTIQVKINDFPPKGNKPLMRRSFMSGKEIKEATNSSKKKSTNLHKETKSAEGKEEKLAKKCYRKCSICSKMEEIVKETPAYNVCAFRDCHNEKQSLIQKIVSYKKGTTDTRFAGGGEYQPSIRRAVLDESEEEKEIELIEKDDSLSPENAASETDLSEIKCCSKIDSLSNFRNLNGDQSLRGSLNKDLLNAAHAPRGTRRTAITRTIRKSSGRDSPQNSIIETPPRKSRRSSSRQPSFSRKSFEEELVDGTEVCSCCPAISEILNENTRMLSRNSILPRSCEYRRDSTVDNPRRSSFGAAQDLPRPSRQSSLRPTILRERAISAQSFEENPRRNSVYKEDDRRASAISTGERSRSSKVADFFRKNSRNITLADPSLQIEGYTRRSLSDESLSLSPIAPESPMTDNQYCPRRSSIGRTFNEEIPEAVSSPVANWRKSTDSRASRGYSTCKTPNEEILSVTPIAPESYDAIASPEENRRNSTARASRASRRSSVRRSIPATSPPRNSLYKEERLSYSNPRRSQKYSNAASDELDCDCKAAEYGACNCGKGSTCKTPYEEILSVSPIAPESYDAVASPEENRRNSTDSRASRATRRSSIRNSTPATSPPSNSFYKERSSSTEEQPIEPTFSLEIPGNADFREQEINKMSTLKGRLSYLNPRKSQKYSNAASDELDCKCEEAQCGVCNCGKGEIGRNQNPQETRYAITRVTKYDDFTTYEILKSTRAKPRKIPEVLEKIFIEKQQ